MGIEHRCRCLFKSSHRKSRRNCISGKLADNHFLPLPNERYADLCPMILSRPQVVALLACLLLTSPVLSKGDEPTQPPTAPALAKLKPVVAILRLNGSELLLGTGTVVTGNGLIFTAEHILIDADNPSPGPANFLSSVSVKLKAQRQSKGPISLQCIPFLTLRPCNFKVSVAQ